MASVTTRMPEAVTTKASVTTSKPEPVTTKATVTTSNPDTVTAKATVVVTSKPANVNTVGALQPPLTLRKDITGLRNI